MTAFSVQPPALRELAGLVDRAKEDVQAGRKYLQEGVSQITGEGLINRITDSHDTVVRTLDTWFGEVADGTMTWHTVATHPAYAEFVEQSLEKAKEFDGGVLTEELGREREKAATEERRQQERAERGDSEDLFRGGVLKRRKR